MSLTIRLGLVAWPPVGNSASALVGFEAGSGCACTIASNFEPHMEFDADPVGGVPNGAQIFSGQWASRAESDAPSRPTISRPDRPRFRALLTLLSLIVSVARI